MIAEKLTERTTGPVSGIRLRAPDAVLPSYDPYSGDDEPTLSAIKIPFIVTTRSRLTLLSVSCFVAGAFLAAALGMLR